MPARQTNTLNLHVDPIIKEAVREAVLRDNRSIANLVEILIRRQCQESGIPTPEQQTLFKDESDG